MFLPDGKNMKPENPTEDNYITCHCQRCDGNIEFNANDLENDELRVVDCPHCNSKTIIFVPTPSMYRSADVVSRAAQIMGIQLDDHATELIVASSLGTPSDMLKRLVFVSDSAKTGGSLITAEITAVALRELTQNEQNEEKAAKQKERMVAAIENYVAITSRLGLDSDITPLPLKNFVGQKKLKEEIQRVIEAAKHENQIPNHILIIGPQGSGKTTLGLLLAGEIADSTQFTGTAEKIAATIGLTKEEIKSIADIASNAVKACNASAIKNVSGLVGVLTSLEESGVLFIDNIDLLPREISESLEQVLADFKLDIVRRARI